MHRYQAPDHTTGIHCPSGNEYRADDKGVVHLKKDAPDADHQALIGAGFTSLELKSPPAAKVTKASKSTRSKPSKSAPAEPAASDA